MKIQKKMWNGWIKWNHDMFGGQKCNILRNMLTASLTGGLWHCSSSGFLLSRGLGQSIWCCPQQHARKVTKRWPLKRRSIIYMVFTMILECVRVVDCVWHAPGDITTLRPTALQVCYRVPKVNCSSSESCDALHRDLWGCAQSEETLAFNFFLYL